MAATGFVLGLPVAGYASVADPHGSTGPTVTLGLPLSTPSVPELDASELPSSDDALDLAGVKCANPVLNNVPHHHSMDAVDRVTGALAYTWNVDITVSKQCNHRAVITSISAYATNVDTADGYRFDGTTEMVIDPSGTSAHATAQFSYFPVRVDPSDPCPPSTKGCPPVPEIALLKHPTISWTVTTRGAANPEETDPVM